MFVHVCVCVMFPDVVLLFVLSPNVLLSCRLLSASASSSLLTNRARGCGSPMVSCCRSSLVLLSLSADDSTFPSKQKSPQHLQPALTLCSIPHIISHSFVLFPSFPFFSPRGGMLPSLQGPVAVQGRRGGRGGDGGRQQAEPDGGGDEGGRGV